LLNSYLESGPDKDELDDGAALANWAVLKGVGLPKLREQGELRQGNWERLWSPVTSVLEGEGFTRLRPLQVMAMWEETSKDPERFVRLLGKDGLLNPKEPSGRNRGRKLRESLGRIRPELRTVRTVTRFEHSGWKYTGTAFLNPATRIVRLAISGSQPCGITGSARTVNLNLKGRLFEDRDSAAGLKVQILDDEFKSQGCQLRLNDRLNSLERLAGGGEAKVSANLNLLIRDEAVTGRLQVDIVSKQAGVALLTGRAVYSVKGEVSRDGKLTAELLSVSTSGSKVLRQGLEKEGNITGTVADSMGSGKLFLPVLKDSLNWHDSRGGNRRAR